MIPVQHTEENLNCLDKNLSNAVLWNYNPGFYLLICLAVEIVSPPNTVFLLQKKSHYQMEKKLLKSEAVHSLLLLGNMFFFSNNIFEYTHFPCKKLLYNVTQYKH